MPIQDSINFLPVGLRDKPLYVKVATLLDYIRQEHHDKLIDEPTGKWDTDSGSYNAQSVIDELDGNSYLEYLQDAESRETMSRLLTGLYRMKGTRRALNLILSLLGIKGTVTSFADVERQKLLGTDQYEIWKNQSEGRLKPCQVLVTLDVDIQQRFDQPQEQVLTALIEAFLWSCTELGAIIVVRYISSTQLDSVQEFSWFAQIKHHINDNFLGFCDVYDGVNAKYDQAGLVYCNDSGPPNTGIPNMFDTVTVGPQALVYSHPQAIYGAAGVVYA